MRRSLVALACALAVMAGLGATGWEFSHPRQASALTNCDTSEAGITPAEQTMLDLINAARAAAGVGALKFSDALNRAAAWKSADSSASGDGFSHTDSLGRAPIQRAKDCGYPPGAGENIAWGSSDPTTIFNLFMSSPGHRMNILLPGYKVIGVALHGYAWTTDFGYVDDSGSTAPPPPSPSPTQPTSAPPTPSPSPAPSASPSSSPSPSPAPIRPVFRVALADLTHD